MNALGVVIVTVTFNNQPIRIEYVIAHLTHAATARVHLCLTPAEGTVFSIVLSRECGSWQR